MSRSWRNHPSRSDRRGGRALGLLAGLTGICGVAWIACGPVTEPLEFSYSVLETSYDSLPETGSQQLYKYEFSTVNPDSIIRALLNKRIPLNEAWEPVTDACASAGDPLGPRFTVLLTEADARLASNHFEPGNGIRPCTLRIRRFLILRSFF